MLKITLVSVGTLKEAYLQLGVAEFTKRLQPYVKLNVMELAEAKLGNNPSTSEIELAKKDETNRLITHLSSSSFNILLDIHGESLSSPQLADKLNGWMQQGASHIVFIIGGPNGVSSDIHPSINYRLSFSRLTFTHQMMRLLLLEQLYRSFKIMKNEPYHK